MSIKMWAKRKLLHYSKIQRPTVISLQVHNKYILVTYATKHVRYDIVNNMFIATEH